jgi:hypothetical protein
MVMSPKGLGPKKDYTAEGQQHIQKARLVFSSERAPYGNRTVIVKD